MRPAPIRRGRPVRTRRRFAAALLVAGACTAGLLAGPPGAVAAGEPGQAAREDRDLREALEGLVASPGGPPGAIALLQRGRDVRVYRAGVADVESGRPPRPGDHMRLASVSKAYSGAVALQLVERGKLRLDDTIGTRLPRLPRAWHKVTLRQLLQHTSGLPDYTESPEFQQALLSDPRREFDPRRLMDFVADEPLMFRPGSRFRYDNSDNIVVALMTEAVTGTPYEELLRRLVYRPLDLRRTSLPRGYLLPRPYLHGYDTEPGRPPEDVSTTFGASSVWASGGIVATPADLNTFMRAYAGDRLLSPAVRKQQTVWVNGSSGPPGPGRNQAGLALFRYTTRCGVVHGHTGNFFGYTQFAATTPDGRRSVTVSITTQTNETTKPALLKRLRAVEEDFVCALLKR
ncbi:serine hydrolase domain-containing protein [Streptomyces sp. NPDC015131]|uniref:serine hydrolase domain-containing protein n=1 Tax=Streptomyces sp. NPDC015131 TaxID=3364941 RepID=UPI0036FD85CC